MSPKYTVIMGGDGLLTGRAIQRPSPAHDKPHLLSAFL
jgi:hypothetical protein